MNKPKLLIIAHINLGTSLSGGDRIFLSIIRYWQRSFKLKLIASYEANRLANSFKLTIPTILSASESKTKTLSTYNLFWHHLTRFFSGLFFSLTHKTLFTNSEYIYTSSDFYGDFIFGFIAKLINPKICWLCGYYLLAPNPFDKNSPYIQTKHFYRGLIYFLAQQPTVLIARHFADYVFVTSLPDVKTFENQRIPTNRIMVVQGGVYIPSISILKSLKPTSARTYDAIYIGRLHSQKGVLEMIDIWHLIVTRLPKAKLVIIGDGELMGEMMKKIKKNNLTKNIKIIGFCIGKEKFSIIRNSKVVLHPATYDSGGMAAAEAMAWGLPGVSFDLPALKTYYPTGMVKTRCFDRQSFADNVIKLLTNHNFYLKYSKDARELTVAKWNWKKRLTTIRHSITK